MTAWELPSVGAAGRDSADPPALGWEVSTGPGRQHSDRRSAQRGAVQGPTRSAALPGGAPVAPHAAATAGPVGSVSGHGSAGPARPGYVGDNKQTHPGPRPTRVRSAALRGAVRCRPGARRGRCGAAGGSKRAERSRTAPHRRRRVTARCGRSAGTPRPVSRSEQQAEGLRGAARLSTAPLGRPRPGTVAPAAPRTARSPHRGAAGC